MSAPDWRSIAGAAAGCNDTRGGPGMRVARRIPSRLHDMLENTFRAAAGACGRGFHGIVFAPLKPMTYALTAVSTVLRLEGRVRPFSGWRSRAKRNPGL